MRYAMKNLKPKRTTDQSVISTLRLVCIFRKEIDMKIKCSESTRTITLIPETEIDMFNLGKLSGSNKIPKCDLTINAGINGERPEISGLNIDLHDVMNIIVNAH